MVAEAGLAILQTLSPGPGKCAPGTPEDVHRYTGSLLP